ncbi:MAG: MBL fold metallo-hydrolase [Coriobacteriales bacterium]|jgi:N-acyl homoserine lactone hydrolase
MGRVIAIKTGSTLVSPAVPDGMSRRSPIAYTMLFQRRKNRIKVPVKCFVLQVAGHTVLIDAGWSPLDARHARKHLGFGLWYASEPVLKPYQAVVPQLHSFGIKVEDLDAVMMTHLDCDHASGLDAFRGFHPVLVSQEEVQYAEENKVKSKVRYNDKLWSGVDFTSINFEEDDDAPFGLSSDIFSDGSITAYLVPGHSKGSVVYVGREDGRYFAIVGDTGYNQKSWTELRMPGVVYDKENLLHGLEWVRGMLEDKNCAGVFCAHDPAIAQGEYDIEGKANGAQGPIR